MKRNPTDDEIYAEISRQRQENLIKIQKRLQQQANQHIKIAVACGIVGVGLLLFVIYSIGFAG